LPTVALPEEIEDLHNIKKVWKFGKRYGDFLEGRNIDVLHSHCYGATLRGAVASFRAGIRHVATQHDNYSVSDKWSRSIWLNIAGVIGTKIVVISNHMLQHYIRHGVKERHCTVVHNGVDENKFNRATRCERNKLRGKLSISESEVVYVAPARLVPVKGFDILIKAFIRLKGTNSRLLIIGDGPLRKELEERVKSYKLGEKVMFTGMVDNVEDYLSIADVFVMASHNEGLSCSIIEAMFASLPVVTTSVGGNSELVKDSMTGYLTSPDNYWILGKYLDKIRLDGIESREKMGRAGLERASTMFTLNNMVNRYIELYNS
jgi:glycosyltransferase involved in cell wall biosynthesis